MQEDRMFQILEAAVREFIATGEPVSSAGLYGKYDFGIRPAMIRAELSDLTDLGYLTQDYHSAGRIPANKGYEFFATRVLESKKPQPRPELEKTLAAGGIAEFLEALSDELGLAAAAETSSGDVVKDGLEELMANLAWGPREAVLQVIRDFELMDERMRALRQNLEGDFLDVFIGRKSPVTKSDELAVIAGNYRLGDGEVILFAVGPKRMNYDKAAAIFKGLKEIGD